MHHSHILIVGNWKMNPGTEDKALKLLRAYKKLDIAASIEVASAVPLPYLPLARKMLSRKQLTVGIQNIFPGIEGSHTGEVSFPMIARSKPKYVILGHSERRAMGETDEMVNQKILAAIKYGVTPVICIGEKVRDDHGFFLKTVEEQLKKCLAGVSRSALPGVVLVYEPVWAIGKDAVRETTPEECREMIVFLKKIVSDIGGGSLKVMPRVLYGGSANELNGREYIEAGADGLLPGRLSLDPKKMQKLLNSLAAIKK